MVVSLAELPAELLNRIIYYIGTARDLSHLSLTCRKIHSVVANDGFRIFVQSKFPSTQIPATDRTGALFWKSAAHGLTTLSRNWDRKAFVAQCIDPWGDSGHLTMESRRSDRRRRRVRSQTMGFTPVIDSHEAWKGDWPSRKQTVAWGAGTELIVGSRELPEPREGCQNQYKWTVYRERGAVDGRDDITCVQLLHGHASEHGYMIVGRVNGNLSRVAVVLDDPNCIYKRLATYDTGGRSVRAANVNSDDLIAACLSDTSLVLYPLNTYAPVIRPVDEKSVGPSGKPGKIWRVRFLRRDRLAIGYGPSPDPIKIYDIGTGRLTKEGNNAKNISLSRRCENNASAMTSVYSLEPLPASTGAGGQLGDLFLSGAYDGVVRLHDIRCADEVAGKFEDPVDVSPVYSLLPFGRERFVAGGAMHALIKVFDLRMPGERMYYATDAGTCSVEPKGWNVFIGKGSASRVRGSLSIESPVYSLSRPSQCSPTFFAGIEDRVVQVDLASVMDKYPDPVYGGLPDTGHRATDIHRKWKPHNRILSLPMYEHNDGPVKLRMQREVGLYKGTFQGWDERWTST